MNLVISNRGDGVGGNSRFYHCLPFRSCRVACREPRASSRPLSPAGGRGVFVEKKFVWIFQNSGGFCRLYSFVGVRGVSSKTIKIGLNCRQELSTRD